jgi:Chaperone of endosialidase
MRFADFALRLLGATSGEQIIKTAAAASGAITLPSGTTDFSATGGAGQVVKQTSAGGAFTVASVAASEVSGLAGLTADALIKGGGVGAAPVASSATVDINGNMNLTGSLAVANAATTGAAGFELGQGRTGSGDAYIDLHAAAGSDYEFRMIRHSGANGGAELLNAGTGTITLQAGGTGAAQLDANGNLSITGYLFTSQTAIGPPTFTTRSAGTRFLVWNATDASNVDYALGIAAGTMWFSIPQSVVSNTFSWYGGINNIMQLAGNGDLTVTGSVLATGYKARSGTAGGVQGNLFNIDWVSTTAHLWMDNVNLGQIAFTSDYRIKENVADLPSTWNQVKGIRPISYNIKDTEDGLFKADPAERWGFIAHELQETLIPTAASGYKDAPNFVQSPDLLALLSATTRALQEAMARIEALEARGASGGG